MMPYLAPVRLLLQADRFRGLAMDPQKAAGRLDVVKMTTWKCGKFRGFTHLLVADDRSHH